MSTHNAIKIVPICVCAGILCASGLASDSQLGAFAPQYFPFEACLRYNQSIINNVGATLVTINKKEMQHDTCVGGNVKVSVEKLPGSEALVEFDFSWDEVEKASDKAYRKLVQKVDIHGFRRGKAPRSLVERKLGK